MLNTQEQQGRVLLSHLWKYFGKECRVYNADGWQEDRDDFELSGTTPSPTSSDLQTELMNSSGVGWKLQTIGH